MLVVNSVSSLLDPRGADLELFVIDQSDDDATEIALRPFADDPRFRYLRSSRRGKGAGLNEGLAAATATVVVLTDDDCRAPAGWALAMARFFESRPSVAIAFCRVVPVPYDAGEGYVPAFEPTQERVLRSITSVRHGLGLGAAMAIRRDIALSLGGFDECFGPGGRFPSADEWDISMRALLKGWHVLETAELSVIHDGFRSFSEGREHARRDWIALGAVCAKPLRAGYLHAVVVPLWIFSLRALWPPLFDLLRLRKPSGFARIAGFARGFANGLMTDVDRKTLLFEPRSQKRANPSP